MKFQNVFTTLVGILFCNGITQISAVDIFREIQVDESTVECAIYEVHGMPISPHAPGMEHIRCVTDNGINFEVINAPKDFMDSGGSGQIKISVPPSNLLNGAIDLAAGEGMVVQYQNSRYRAPDREGDFRMAVIRVTDRNNVSPDKSASDLSDDIFGTNGDPLNLVTGYNECSGGKVRFSPGVGTDIVDGVMELTLDNKSISGQSSYTVENWVTEALSNKQGWNLNAHTHVMYILPEAVNFGGAAAYAYLGSYTSVFWNKYASMHLVLMHEIGHNFDHLHSGENNASYGDETCMLGAHVYADDSPRSCFNGAKSWWFGWYSDRHIQVTPTSSNFLGKLLSIHDYLNDETNANDQKTIIRVTGSSETDLYIMYNRAEGINSEVPGYKDMVTIVEQDGDASQSWVKGGLSSGQIYEQNNWNNSGRKLIIKVCDTVMGRPDYASVIIYIQNQNDLTCDSNPIQSPTSAPQQNPPPQSDPTSAPQPGPTSSPQKNPTAPTSGDCKILCCYPIDNNGNGGWANDYMLGVCESKGCHYEMWPNGSPYCSGKDYHSCLPNCSSKSPIVSPTVSPTAASSSTPSASLPTTNACIPAGSKCFTKHSGKGCDDESCKLKVCDILEKCCSKKWSKKCKRIAVKSCTTTCTCVETWDEVFLLKVKKSKPKTKTCQWLKSNSKKKRKKICKKFDSFGEIQAARFVCPNTCNLELCNNES